MNNDLISRKDLKKTMWIEMTDNYGHSSYFCSRCGTQEGKPYEVCKNCGADMKEVDND